VTGVWRVARLLVAAFAAYAAVIASAGFLAKGCVTERVRSHLAESLDAEVMIGGSSLRLLRGTLVLRDVVIERRRGGDVDIAVGRVEARLAPLGGAVLARAPREVAASDIEMTISARGAVAMARRPPPEPMRLRSLALRDARIALMPTTWLPRFGRIELSVEEAVTGPLVLRDGLSWMFAVERLRARASVPGGVDVALGYADETLSVGAGLFGAEPVTLHFPLPDPDLGGFELEQVRVLASRLARALAREIGAEWMRREARERFEELILDRLPGRDREPAAD
jgi:hypothetical protein